MAPNWFGRSLLDLTPDIFTKKLEYSHISPVSSSAICDDAKRPTFIQTCIAVIALAAPLAVSRLSWVAMKTTDTALIGHTSTLYLSASAVADLYTQSTGVFISGGILSTFVAQAYGSTNKVMGGIWLQVSLVVVGVISVPVMISWLVCGPMLIAMDVSRNLIGPAEYYALVLVTAIPPRVCIGQLSQFLMAQKIANPLVKTGLFGMTVNLVAGIVFVLGIGVPGWQGFGFWACPVVTVLVEWITLFVYIYWFCYKKRLHTVGGCWPSDGFQLSYITFSRVKQFNELYFPAALAAASDWWRVSAIGAVAVSFHDEASLAVFNSAYRVTWMSLIIIGSVGSAMGVLLGQELGKGDHQGAKDITSTCLIMAFIILIILGAICYAIPDKIAMIFSSDHEVLELYSEVALPLAFTLVAMNLSVFLERIPLSCGRSKVVLWTGVVGSWAAQVPAVLLFTQFYRNDLYGLFTGVAVGYSFLDLLLMWVVFTTDWEFYAMEALQRSEVIGEDAQPTEAVQNSFYDSKVRDLEDTKNTSVVTTTFNIVLGEDEDNEKNMAESSY